MKILHTFQHYLPTFHGGMQEVIKQISERLAMIGHDVTIATCRDERREKPILNGVKIAEFAIAGNAVAGYAGEKSEIRRYQEYLALGDFDIITNFAAQQWATDLAFDVLGDIKGKKVFVPTGFSGLNKPEFREYYKNMKSNMLKYDMNVFLSDEYQDHQFARAYGIEKRITIPNGADERDFSEKRTGADIRRMLRITPGHSLVLHVGSHTGMKGHDEAMRIFAQSSVTSSTLLIAGNTPQGFNCRNECSTKAEEYNESPRLRKDNKRIIIAELSRSDIISAYCAADVFLFPSNIECSPIVLFEAAASHTPFLTTDVGNSTEIIRWLECGVLMPTVSVPWHQPREAIKEILRNIAFRTGLGRTPPRNLHYAAIPRAAKQLAMLLSDNQLRAAMAERGFVNWREKFTWENIANQYERLYRMLSSQSG